MNKVKILVLLLSLFFLGCDKKPEVTVLDLVKMNAKSNRMTMTLHLVNQHGMILDEEEKEEMRLWKGEMGCEITDDSS
ncbi:hypothetical protein LCGC14_0970560 [marine sediment metagenome]|uniref:Uncharacterized protein n=1 Tax=marine sediment metagenome TaxID=412755 RepID=A0A0F9QUZ5_9ZZZZ